MSRDPTIASLEAADAATPFSWRDAERLVCYGRGTARQALRLVSSEGLGPFILLTGSHGELAPADLAAAARVVIAAPPGPVPATASTVSAVFADPGVDAIVAIGGGRVIDVAKALAAAYELKVAALPTTLSGAEMSAGHRPMADGFGAAPRRPRLVVNDPALSASQPLPDLAASAMNALAHAMEAFYGSGAQPAGDAAAARAAGLICAHLEAVARQSGRHARAEQGVERDSHALGALLAGYALGTAGVGFHHVLCQTIVQRTGARHAAVNAVMLPHTFRRALTRARDALAPFVRAVTDDGDEAAAVEIAELVSLSGATRLSDLGVGADDLPAIVAAATRRAELARPAPAPSAAELQHLLESAL